MNLVLEATALTPRQLDYAIAKARGRAWAAQQVIDNPDYYYRPTTDWHYCGPLLDQIPLPLPSVVHTRPELLKVVICRVWLQTFVGEGVSIPFTFLTEQQVREFGESLDWS